MPKITILTPTYNRAKNLIKLYESLLNQTNKDFEWLLIDDGSSDETESMISSYIVDNEIAINYLKKSNGGKHSALNIGFKEANADWIFIVDSDDWLKEDTVQILIEESSKLSSEYNSMSLLRAFSNGDVIGDYFPEFINTHLDKIQNFIKGDKAELIRKSSVDSFRFPEYPNENFMAESPLFLWLGSTGKTKFINYPCYICEYLPGGLTDNSIKNRYRCINSTLFVYYNQYRTFNSQRLKIRAAINWWRFRSSNRSTTIETPNLSLIYKPLGYGLYLFDKIKGNVP